MSFLLEHLRTFAESVILALSYPGIVLVMLLENLFPPIPSEVVVPFAGSLVAQSVLSFWGVMVATTVGAVVLYGLGAWLNAARSRSFFRRYGRWLGVSEDDFGKALGLCSRHDRAVVFWARLLPGIRSLISVPAGVARMPVGRFLLFTTLGTSVWNLALASVGVVLARNWEQVLTVVDRFEGLMWLTLAVAVLWWGARRTVRTEAAAKP